MHRNEVRETDAPWGTVGPHGFRDGGNPYVIGSYPHADPAPDHGFAEATGPGCAETGARSGFGMECPMVKSFLPQTSRPRASQIGRSLSAGPYVVRNLVLRGERERLPESVRSRVDRMAETSRDLRRDRELAFYGAEDLVPSEFYGEEDAHRALEGARFVIEATVSVVPVSGNDD